MAASFIAEEGELKGLVLSLDNGPEWVIGRDPDVSNVVIEDSLVSRKHVLCRETTAGITIHNLSQTNPIFVNGEELEGTVLLKSGDKVQIGGSLYNFDSDTPIVDAVNEEITPLDTPNTTNNEEENLSFHEEPHNEAEEPMEEPDRDTIFEEEDEKSAFAEINFGMVNTGRWLLKVINGPNSGAEFFMHPNSSLIVGTDPNACDIVFHDTSVSRQHLKLTISPENIITVEDLSSRNGTLVDGQQIKEKRELPLNTTVTTGTTTFVVYDREAEMKTIISPLLPSILKTLQKEETASPENQDATSTEDAAPLTAELEPKKAESHNIAGLITLGIITGLFVIAGIGISSLFHHETVELSDHATNSQDLTSALAEFPSLKSFYTASTGKLYLVGHLLNTTEKNQLLYNIRGLKFIKDIDDTGVVVDENVWNEMNQILNKNPNWKGVSIYASSPAKFVLSGNLQSRKQAEQLSDYITSHFPYPDLLEKRIIVEEDVVSSVSSQLRSIGLRDVVVQLANGELTLTGVIPRGKTKDFEAALVEIKKDTGVRNIRNFVNEVAPGATMINISDKYDVTGYSKLGSGAVSVVINGKILSKGAILDGMTIKEIQPHAVLLEKDNVEYRIDFNH